MAAYEVAHLKALKAEEHVYEDPDTGYSVFSALAHLERGKCCGSACRHCPYAFENVRANNFVFRPTWLHGRPPLPRRTPRRSSSPAGANNASAAPTSPPTATPPRAGPPSHALMWSGGKESLLALRALIHKGIAPSDIALMACFDPRSRVLVHGNMHVDEAVRQARHLKLPLLGLPAMPPGTHCNKRQPLPDSPLTAVVVEALQFWRDEYGLPLRAVVLGGTFSAHSVDVGALELTVPFVYPLDGHTVDAKDADLGASGVLCALSSSPAAATAATAASVGAGFEVKTSPVSADEFHPDTESAFDAAVASNATSTTTPPSGHAGPLHTIAKVWLVSRELALGLA